MSKFFYNIADKNACFLINCKILVTRNTKILQTVLLADYEHAKILRSFLWQHPVLQCNNLEISRVDGLKATIVGSRVIVQLIF